MSTVRIQVRRGTSADWSSANPILAAGEMGVETNTRKIKVGDGSTAWNSLDYIASDAPAIGEIAQDAINNALSMGDGVSKTYDDNANTITIENTGVLSFNTRTGAVVLLDTDVTDALGYTPANVVDVNGLGSQTAEDIAAAIATAGTYTDTIATATLQSANSHSDQFTQDAIADLVANDLHIDQDLYAGGDINADGNLNVTNANISGNLYVQGTTTTVNSETMNVSDPIIYVGADNAANLNDLGIVGSFTKDGTYQHSGLVRDASDDSWKLFKGVTDEPGSTVNFTQGSLDNLKANILWVEEAHIGDVTNAQVQYLKNLSRDINDSLNDKADKVSPTFLGTVILPNDTIKTQMIEDLSVTTQKIDDAAITTAKIENLSITNSKIGNSAVEATQIANDAVITQKIQDNAVTTAKIVDDAVTTAKIVNDAVTTAKIAANSVTTAKVATGAITGEKIADATITGANISSVPLAKVTDLETTLDGKANIDSQTFTGVVTLPSTTSIGNVSDLEIAHLNGVTSAIQTQIDTKADSSDLTSHTSSTTSVHGIADTSALATKTYADNAVSTHEADTTSVHGIADTSALATKTYADSAVSTHNSNTTTAHGVTGAVVGTTNTQTLTNKTLTSPVINSPTGIVKADVGLGNVDNTSDANKPVSTATQTALDAKASLSGATFTGAVSGTSLTLSGNLTVNGTTTTVNTTNFTTSDPVIYLGEGNNANSVDLGFVASYNDGTYAHQGLVKDTSDGKWKLFKGVTDEPTTTVNFAQGSLDTLAVGALEATSATIGNVSNTELQYLDGVTSSIQTQLNAKAPSSSPTLATPTITGALTLSASGVVFTDGTQTKAGVPSITAIGTTRSASETIASGEQDKFVPVSGAVTITLPSTGYSTGQSIDFWQSAGTGAQFAGTGVVGTPGLKLRTTYSVATAMKIDGGWLVFGDLSA